MNQINNNGLKSGTMLRNGTYRIERILGQGGFGITYFATDLSLERCVAIKEFFPREYCDRNKSTSHVRVGTSSNTELVLRLKVKFIKEARNIAKLDHAGIIKIHTAFEENNTAYYVMDYIDGRNLNEIIRNSGPLSEAKSIKYITQVGEALDYIHSRKINHLDVKPANIMIRRYDDRPILIDFGLSKQYDENGNQTSTTPTGISHGYAPMEQYKVGGVSEFSPQTDLYSLAATLYYLVSGIVPPHATDLVEKGINFPTGFPIDIRQAISKSMSSARKNRYSCVLDFIRTINEKDRSESTNVITAETADPLKNSDPSYGYAKKSNSKRNAIIICLIIIISGVAVFLSGSHSEVLQSNDAVEFGSSNITKGDKPHFVNGAKIQTTLGNAIYSGEIDENGLPHGKGIAIWEKGEGIKYDGEWNHGNMEGLTSYTHRSGDTFVGIFKDNHYYNGRYTVKEDGTYFEGTFKNGQPDEGLWYYSSGRRI